METESGRKTPAAVFCYNRSIQYHAGRRSAFSATRQRKADACYDHSAHHAPPLPGMPARGGTPCFPCSPPPGKAPAPQPPRPAGFVAAGPAALRSTCRIQISCRRRIRCVCSCLFSFLHRARFERAFQPAGRPAGSFQRQVSCRAGHAGASPSRFAHQDHDGAAGHRKPAGSGSDGDRSR